MIFCPEIVSYSMFILANEFSQNKSSFSKRSLFKRNNFRPFQIFKEGLFSSHSSLKDATQAPAYD